MPKRLAPVRYLVYGLEIVEYSKPDKNSEVVVFKTPKDTRFVLAKDIMGIQFCADGRMWPDAKSWPSMEAATAYIKEHTADAIAFFDSDDPGEKQFNVADVAYAAACVEAKISPN
jgi:hypothetical protein